MPADGEVPGEIVLGVRPEHALLWNDGGDLVGPLEGRVDYVEALGRETFIGVTVVQGAHFVVEVEGHFRAEVGETVRFGLRPGRLHVFDAHSEQALSRV